MKLPVLFMRQFCKPDKKDKYLHRCYIMENTTPVKNKANLKECKLFPSKDRIFYIKMLIYII